MRRKVLLVLGETRNPRGAPCFVEVLKHYEPDSNEDEVRIAARAVVAMKVKEAADPLFEVFKKLRHGRPKGSLITRDVHDALLVLSEP